MWFFKKKTEETKIPNLKWGVWFDRYTGKIDQAGWSDEYLTLIEDGWIKIRIQAPTLAEAIQLATKEYEQLKEVLGKNENEE